MVAQITVEGFVRGHPLQPQLHAQLGGQYLGQLDVDASGLAILYETVGGIVFVDGHLEVARLDNFIMVTDMRDVECLRRHCQQQTAPQADNAQAAHALLLYCNSFQPGTDGP